MLLLSWSMIRCAAVMPPEGEGPKDSGKTSARRRRSPPSAGRGRDTVGDRAHGLGRMRHGDAEARDLDHLEIIVVVADRHDSVERDAEVRGEMRERRPLRRSHGQELEVVLRRVHEARIVPEQPLEIGAKHDQVPPMPDEEPLHEGTQPEEILGIGDHVSAQPLVVAELPDGQRPIEAVELLVAEEDRVHGRGREGLPGLGEDAARQLTPEELRPAAASRMSPPL